MVTAYGAQSVSLSIPEILESILLQLDNQTLLTAAQQTCCAWRGLIHGSPSLQKALFFLPEGHSGREDEEKAQNPLLMQRFPSFFGNSKSALLYAIWSIFFNLYLHSLCSYPGPFLATVSRIPYATAYAQGKLHIYVRDLYYQYGNVVRIAPDELSYCDEHAWKDIYSHSRNFPKDMGFYNSSKKKAASVVIAPDEIHQRQKRAILRAFSDSALRNHERLLQPFVDMLIKRLQDTISLNKYSPIDLTEWYNYVMFDFMAQELFGESLGCLEDTRYHPWVDMLFGSIKAWAVISISKYFPSIAFIIKPAVLFFYRDLLRYRDTKHASISLKTPRRLDCQQDGADFIKYIQHTEDPKSTLHPEEIFSNSSFLMMAGSETTATLLSGCTFLILKRPEVYSELVTQVRRRFTSASEISFSSLAEMPYLRSVLQESLRIYPPLPLGMPRVVPDGGAVISGRFVPGKTSVAVASWAAYLSPSNFTNPHSFLPERWLESTLDGEGDKKGVFQPFSIGPRGCPGKSLAFSEASLILAKLLWSFDLQFSSECPNWINQRAYIIWDKKPLMVNLIPRTVDLETTQ